VSSFSFGLLFFRRKFPSANLFLATAAHLHLPQLFLPVHVFSPPRLRRLPTRTGYSPPRETPKGQPSSSGVFRSGPSRTDLLFYSSCSSVLCSPHDLPFVGVQARLWCLFPVGCKASICLDPKLRLFPGETSCRHHPQKNGFPLVLIYRLIYFLPLTFIAHGFRTWRFFDLPSPYRLMCLQRPLSAFSIFPKNCLPASNPPSCPMRFCFCSGKTYCLFFFPQNSRFFFFAPVRPLRFRSFV